MSENRRNLAFYALITLCLVLVSDVPSDNVRLFSFAQALLAIVLGLCFVLPVRQATVLLMILCISGRDIDALESADVMYQTASIWQLHVGSLNPSMIVFACVAVQLAKLRRIVVTPEVKHATYWFASVPLAAAFAYGFLGTDNLGNILSDVKLPLMLLISIVMFHSLIRQHTDWLLEGFTALAAAALARHAVDLVYFFLNIGPRLGEGNRVSLDSAKGLVVLLLLLSVFLVQFGRRRISGAAMGVGATLLLCAYATRLLYLTGLLGGLMLAPLYGAKKSLQTLALFLLVGAAGVWALSVLRPEMASVAYGRIQSMTASRNYDVSVDRNFLSALDPSRYAQIVNVVHDTKQRNAWLWGSGYGSYYTDTAVAFPDDLADTFPEEWHHKGEFYRSHNYFVHFFLKYGLCGLLVFSALWYRPMWRAYRAIRSEMGRANRMSRSTFGYVSCAAAFAITGMLQLHWSAKGLLINGFIIAACSAYASMCASTNRQLLRTRKAQPLLGSRRLRPAA